MPEGDRVIPYATIRQAIIDRQSLTAIYDNYVRHFSPHILGRDRSLEPAVVAFQYGGGRMGGLPNAGEWCFFHVSGLKDLSQNRDPWMPGRAVGKPKDLIVDIDVSA
ncbi:MAG TPA: hypothetical protein VFB13_10085 [Reyranella sp.]|jgi:hypothetical protein|nr:hypothetical protein [Reyranella sp.]